MSSGVEYLISPTRDLIRSFPSRSTSGLPIYVAASPAAPFSTSLEMTTRSYLLRFDCQFYRGCEIVRQCRFKAFPFLSTRMAKSKLPGMQHLSRKILRETRCVDIIAEHRVTEMMKMHANLMSPSAVQPTFNETGALARPNDAKLGFGRASAQNRRAHSLPVDWMASDLFFDYSSRLAQSSRHQRKINLLHRTVSKLHG